MRKEFTTIVNTHTKCGKTSSGREIHNVPPDHEVYKLFTPQDHIDAAVHFKGAANELTRKAYGGRNEDFKLLSGNAELFTKWGDAHLALAKGGGEGSKGGKVIGHTKSGKPIYEADHEVYAQKGHGLHEGGVDAHVKARRDVFRQHYPGWTKEDHHDAMETHSLAGKAHSRHMKEIANHPDYPTDELKKKFRSHGEKWDKNAYAANQHGMFGYGVRKPSKMSKKPV